MISYSQKKLNYLISSVLFSLSFLFIFVGCNKKKVNIENDSQIVSEILGAWEIKYMSQIELSSDPGTEYELYQGEVEVISSTMITFFEDNKYKMEIQSEINKLTLLEDAPFSEDDVKQQIENTLCINGTFLIDQNYLELNGENVTTLDGSVFTIKEYSKIDSNIGNDKQITKWTIEGNELILMDLSGKNQIAYIKQ